MFLLLSGIVGANSPSASPNANMVLLLLVALAQLVLQLLLSVFVVVLLLLLLLFQEKFCNDSILFLLLVVTIPFFLCSYF